MSEEGFNSPPLPPPLPLDSIRQNKLNPHKHTRTHTHMAAYRRTEGRVPLRSQLSYVQITVSLGFGIIIAINQTGWMKVDLRILGGKFL